MMKLLFATLLLSTPALAVKHLPPKHARKPAVNQKAVEVPVKDADAELTALEKELLEFRKQDALEMKEDLKVSTNGKDVEMEKISPAPEDTSTEN